MINKDIINIDDVLVIKTKDQFIKEFGDDWMSKVKCGWIEDMDYSFGSYLVVTKAIYENIKKYKNDFENKVLNVRYTLDDSTVLSSDFELSSSKTICLYSYRKLLVSKRVFKS